MLHAMHKGTLQMLVVQVAACSANVTGTLAWLVYTGGHVFVCGFILLDWMKLHKDWVELHKNSSRRRPSGHARALICRILCPVTYIAAPSPRTTSQLHPLLVLAARLMVS